MVNSNFKMGYAAKAKDSIILPWLVESKCASADRVNCYSCILRCADWNVDWRAWVGYSEDIDVTVWKLNSLYFKGADKSNKLKKENGDFVELNVDNNQYFTLDDKSFFSLARSIALPVRPKQTLLSFMLSLFS